MTLLERIAINFASLGPVGKLPIPGTWGSAVAALAAPVFFMPAPFTVRLFILVLVFLVGSLACDVTEKALGRKDPGLCVIDEVLGQWTAYLPFATLTPWQFFWGFVIFRIFDIWKPYPVRASEGWLPGGFGVVVDDGLAGIYSSIVLGLLMAMGL